jgi:hypothetical protein
MQVSDSRLAVCRRDVGDDRGRAPHKRHHQRAHRACALDPPRGPQLGAADAPDHGVARHMQHELLERGVEVQRVGARAVVAGEIARLEPCFAAVLRDDANAAHLQADQHHLFARVADAAAGAPDGLALGNDGRKMQAVAGGRRDLAEEPFVSAGLAVEFNKRVADRVLPELKTLALGNIGRRQYGFHGTAPGLSMIRYGSRSALYLGEETGNVRVALATLLAKSDQSPCAGRQYLLRAQPSVGDGPP